MNMEATATVVEVPRFTASGSRRFKIVSPTGWILGTYYSYEIINMGYELPPVEAFVTNDY